MLKYMVLITMSVFGAASIAVAGMPITTMSVKPEIRGNGRAATRVNTITVAPGLRQIKRPTVQLKKPNPIPKAGMRRRVQKPGTQLRPAGHKGMIFSGRRPSLRLPPPRLRVIRISSKISSKCPDPNKFSTNNIATVNATIYNGGGPFTHDQSKSTSIYVWEVWGSGNAELTSHTTHIPPLAHGQQAVVKMLVYGMRRDVKELPGTHKLWVYRAGPTFTRFTLQLAPLKITFPPGYCQPKTKSVTQGLTIYRPLLNKLSLGGGVGRGSVTHGKMPDLIPQVSNPFNGIIKVRNIGGATAAASKLTVNCKKLGGGTGDCPSTPALDSLPTDASGALLISVPALHAGQVHTIHLPVQGLKWDKGKYRFTYKADATHAVAESNESNNKVVMNMGVMNMGSFSMVSNGRKADLIPQVSNPFNGIIKVRNIGGATAGASKLTVNCEKIGGGFVSAGDCPSTPALDRLDNASGALVESVPALHAGQVYTISLPVQGLKWDKGKYRFTYKADATHAVAESNESNNVKTMVRQR